MGFADKVNKIAVGDRVAYKASFLRNTGQYTGKIPFARGIVESVKDLGSLKLATIDWGDADIPKTVNIANLSKVTTRGIADE